MSKGSKIASKFEEVYTLYYERLFAFALVITDSEANAHDVVSQVFFNLWEKNSDLSNIKDLKSYLFTAVKNQSIRQIANDQYFHTEDIEEVLISIDQVNPEELLIGKELEDFIEKAIDKLPDQCGLVFKMVKEKNMSYKEVASELGISKYTAKYHMETALKKILSEVKSRFSDAKIVKWISAGATILLLAHYYIH